MERGLKCPLSFFFCFSKESGVSSFTKFDGRLFISYCEEASKVLGKDHWLLEKEFIYYVGSLDSNTFVKVPRGFLSDGASVPAIARIFVPRMGMHSQASFLHDYLCEHYRVSIWNGSTTGDYMITRRKIDEIYFEALEVSKVSFWRRFCIKAGVNLYRFIARPVEPKPYKKKRELEEKYRVMFS